MISKKLLFFAAGISAAWLLYRKIGQQPKNDRSVEISSDLQALKVSLQHVKDTASQLEKQLAETSFADELQDSWTEYQFKLQPIIKHLEDFQKR